MILSNNLIKGLLSLILFFLHYTSFSQKNSTPHCGFDPIHQRLKASDPAYQKAVEDYKKRILPHWSNEQMGRAGTINVPVVVHIIHAGENEGEGSNLSIARIEAQIEILNQDFSATNPNYGDTPARWAGAIGNPDIQFCLASIDPDGSPTNGINRQQMAVTGTDSNNNNIESEIKPAVNWNPAKYYNIYVLPIPGTTASGGVTGYAYLPYNGTVGNPNIDGTVVDYHWFGGPGFGQSGYKTLTHETGHYLGLFHTFDGYSCTDDDGIGDTPNISAPTADQGWFSCNGGFPAGPTSCGNEHMYVNYMDYSSGSCYTSFTQGQINVMRAVMEGNAGNYGWGSRAELATSSASVCALLEQDAAVTAVLSPQSSVCDDNSIVPEVTITNFGTARLENVLLRYQLDGGPLQEINVQPGLIAGASANVELPAINPAASPFEFTVFTAQPNGVTDEQPANDTMRVTSNLISPQMIDLEEGFEEGPFDPTTDGIIVFNVNKDAYSWQRTTLASANGSASVMMDNYNAGQEIFGTLDALLTPVYDFSASSNATLHFDLAYATYSGNGNTLHDSLLILVSTDCGAVYDQTIYRNGNNSLATSPPTNSPFTPNPNEWQSISIDLSDFDNLDNVSFAFVNKSGWGNRLFLDNINIQSASGCAISVTSNTTDLLCHSDCTGSASIEASGGNGNFTYQWDSNANNQTTSTASHLCAGDYQLTISDSDGCSLITSVSISQPEPLLIHITPTHESTSGAHDGTAAATVSGGTTDYSYLWSNGQSSAQISNLQPGSYQLTVTDANGCTAQAAVTIEQGEMDCSGLAIELEWTGISCAEGADGSISAFPINGSGNVTYLWSNQQQSQTISNLISGTYGITITDASGCSTADELFLPQPEPLLIHITPTHESTSGAHDGTAAATVSGGTTDYGYLWSNGQSSAQISNLQPGSYQLTVTDANGCTAQAAVTIEQGASSSPCTSLQFGNTLSTHVSCFGGRDGSISTTILGGEEPYSFQWSNGASSASIDGLTAGHYSLTVHDPNECTLSMQLEIEEPSAIELIPHVFHSACGFPGTVSIDVVGGHPPYTYQWSNGSEESLLTDLDAGTYLLTLTDANGCVLTDELIVESVSEPLVASMHGQDVSCAEQADGSIEVEIHSGNPPFIYIWSNGDTTEAVNGLEAGMYHLQIIDSKGCTYVWSTEIHAPQQLEVEVITENPSSPVAADGSASAAVSGGTPPFSYQWSNGASGVVNGGLAAGSYLLIVTDANDCTAEVPFELGGSTAIGTIKTLRSLVLFPNPTSALLSVFAKFDRQENVQIQLLNVLGSELKVYRYQGASLQQVIDLSSQPAGLYWIRIATPEASVSKKVVLAR